MNLKNKIMLIAGISLFISPPFIPPLTIEKSPAGAGLPEAVPVIPAAGGRVRAGFCTGGAL